jgi:hypothetical protein
MVILEAEEWDTSGTEWICGMEIKHQKSKEKALQPKFSLSELGNG